MSVCVCVCVCDGGGGKVQSLQQSVYCLYPPQCVLPASDQRKPTVRVLCMQIADPAEVIKTLDAPSSST